MRPSCARAQAPTSPFPPTLIEGRHFPRGADAALLGHKASPSICPTWRHGGDPALGPAGARRARRRRTMLRAFARGSWRSRASIKSISSDGDTTRGHWTICVQIMGEVPRGQAAAPRRRESRGRSLGLGGWVKRRWRCARPMGESEFLRGIGLLLERRLHAPTPRFARYRAGAASRGAPSTFPMGCSPISATSASAPGSGPQSSGKSVPLAPLVRKTQSRRAAMAAGLGAATITSCVHRAARASRGRRARGTAVPRGRDPSWPDCSREATREGRAREASRGGGRRGRKAAPGHTPGNTIILGKNIERPDARFLLRLQLTSLRSAAGGSHAVCAGYIRDLARSPYSARAPRLDQPFPGGSRARALVSAYGRAK